VGYALFILGLMHLFEFWFGRFADRRPKTTVLTGCLFTAVLFLLLGFSKTYMGLLLFLLILGAGRSIWNISAWTLMSKLGEMHRIEGQVVGSYVSLAKIGGFVSYLVSGFILAAHGFNTLFIVSGIVLLVGVLISSFYFRGLSHKIRKHIAKQR
jgi:predicted MFS family arabinose efflux permease